STWDQTLHDLSPAHFQLMTRTVVRSFRQLRSGRLRDLRMVVSQQQSTMTARIVDILVTVDIPLARTGRSLDLNRVGLQVSTVVRPTAGKQLCGLLGKFGRLASSLAESVEDGRVRGVHGGKLGLEAGCRSAVNLA